MKVVSLQIAAIHIAEEPTVISTILGSCVSVCLFTPESQVAGMIHFALPKADGPNTEPLRYGNSAISQLIDAVTKASGLKAKQFRAKIIGGGSVLSELAHASQIGLLNVEMAERELEKRGIQVVGRDVLGELGRKVYFYTETGRVRVGLIESSRQQSQPSIPLAQAPSPAQAQPATAKPVQPVNKTPARARRVYIIDDSKTIRDLLKKIFSSDPGLDVIGSAANPIEAEPELRRLKPDVVTLDIHMPEMDGVTFLRKIMPQLPLPFVMITAISKEESTAVFDALELGAVDYIQKPNLSDLVQLGPMICEKVKEASFAKVAKYRPRTKATKSFAAATAGLWDKDAVIALGASTGGTEALKDVLVHLPASLPPIVIVQHIPPVFSGAFARRLHEICSLEVKEAEDGDELRSGLALIAPGGKQMELQKKGGTYRVRVFDGEPVNRHKPSVDVLFDSVAKLVGPKAFGAILTGMGNDGARGLLQMRQAGARTVAQDEATSVVYGMPKVAFELGAVETVLPLEGIAPVLVRWSEKRKAA